MTSPSKVLHPIHPADVPLVQWRNTSEFRVVAPLTAGRFTSFRIGFVERREPAHGAPIKIEHDLVFPVTSGGAGTVQALASPSWSSKIEGAERTVEHGRFAHCYSRHVLATLIDRALDGLSVDLLKQWNPPADYGRSGSTSAPTPRHVWTALTDLHFAG